jgi:hypothetical protein
MRDQSNESPSQMCGDLHAPDRDPSDSLFPSRLNRQDAARFLSQRGLPIAATTLAKKAVEGSGPPYAVWNGRALYSVDDLLKWAEVHLGPKIRNTAERSRTRL